MSLRDGFVAERLVQMEMSASVPEVHEILDFLTTLHTVRRGAGTERSPFHGRARVRELLVASAWRAREILQVLDTVTPSYHPGYESVALIPARCFDATHSDIPRPTDPVRNHAFYCGNPRKRGFHAKIPIVTRTWDGAVLYVGAPTPGRYADVNFPPDRLDVPS